MASDISEHQAKKFSMECLRDHPHIHLDQQYIFLDYDWEKSLIGEVR